MGDLWWRLGDALRLGRDRFVGFLLDTPHLTYAAAVARIGTGLSVLGLLLSNWSTRDLWAGQASIWAEPARDASAFPEIALLDGVSGDVLTVVYVATLVAAAAFTIGWRTKVANVVTYLGFIAIVAQNPVVGVQGDNLVRLTLLWLLLMRTSDHWSWDARRRERIGGGEIDGRAWDDAVLPAWGSNALHNTGLVALGAQTVLAYTAAGLDKVADGAWQRGTALWSTLQLPESRPFPWLADLVSESRFGLALLTYAVLLTQLFFGPLLLSRITRRIVIVAAVLVSVVFAVLFAAPWSQLAVVAVTLLFVSDRTWRRVEDAVLERLDPLGALFGDRVPELFDSVGDRVSDAIDAITRWIPARRGRATARRQR